MTTQYRRIADALGVLCALCTMITPVGADVRLENGVLQVDGKPFFPLGSWGYGSTSADDLARLGMNTAFRGAPGTEEHLQAERTFMRECAQRGVYVIEYLSYGGREASIPWPPEKVRSVAQLASEPNLLAWNVGDDIYLRALPGLRQTVSILREEAPGIPTIADCAPAIGRSEEGAVTFRDYVDVTMNYNYPLPDWEEYPTAGNAFRKHQEFFDEQRQLFGDPLWTWTQTYLWHWTGQDLNVSPEGPGPYPEPEQVRLLFFSEINRGVRGLLCFSHREIHLQPNIAAEIAVTFREIALLSDHFAAGAPTYRLPVSDSTLDATAFTYGGSSVLSLALLRDGYQHWVDEGIVRNATVECPWDGSELPQVLLVVTPDVVDCAVERTAPGKLSITIPELELAGFVLVSADREEIERLGEGVAAIPAEVRTLVIPGMASHLEKINEVVWQSGAFSASNVSLSLAPVRALERAAAALDDRRYDDVLRERRTMMRLCRAALDSVMRSARGRAGQVLQHERRFLRTPYGLHNLRGLAQAPPVSDRWSFIRTWEIAGPFPLKRDWEDLDAVPAGFETPYPPETDGAPSGRYSGVDGATEWQYAEADLSGRLDVLPYFRTTEDVLVYGRCRITAPYAIKTSMSLGSNDGAKVWLNGELCTSVPAARGRKAFPHQDEFPVSLRAGENRVLVKLANLGANWQLYLSVDDPERKLSFMPGW